MPIEADSAPARGRIARRVAAGCEGTAVAAWLLLVLRDQYGVAWLQPREIAVDALFLLAVVGTLAARKAARDGGRRLAAVAFRAGIVVVATGAAVVAAELGARYAFRHARSSGNAGDYIAARGGGPAIAINSLGFRDREVPPKAQDRYRIVVVGDSFTWGQGVEAADRFTDLLAGFLGPRYEVLNFGLPGNNLPEHLDVLARALPVAPDFVVLQLYINDFEMPDMQRPRSYALLPASLDHALERTSLLYDLINNQWGGWQQTLGIAESYEAYMARNLRDPAAPSSVQAFGLLREFVYRSREAGVPCGIVLFPAPDAMGPHGTRYPFGYLHDRVRMTCGEERVPCLDLLEAFSKFKDPRSTWVSPFDAHPNAMANRRAAYEILQRFGSIWQR
jgi:lysophospholipase L1-like esterase